MQRHSSYRGSSYLSNGDLNLYTGLDGDGSDLLNDLRGGVEIDETLVDAHLEAIPGLGTVTARGLTGGDTENLGGETDGTLDLELLVLGTLDEISADLLQVLDVAGGQGDADTVDPKIGKRGKIFISFHAKPPIGVQVTTMSTYLASEDSSKPGFCWLVGLAWIKEQYER